MNKPINDRPIDEHYDTQKVVAQDPCGALMAIQWQAATIRALVEALEFATNVFDTPVARRRIAGEYAAECRSSMRSALTAVKE